jgi:ADP-ribose pyrophosphatase YjhB (NUDIX family)
MFKKIYSKIKSRLKIKIFLKKEIVTRAIVLNQKKEILVVSEDGMRWHFPGGMLEGCESMEGCAVRETQEETGLYVQIVKIKAISDNLRDCRASFCNFLRTVMVYYCAKTTASELPIVHIDTDRCIKHRKFLSEKEFLELREFFPKELQKPFSVLFSDEFFYFPFEIFSEERLRLEDIQKILK